MTNNSMLLFRLYLTLILVALFTGCAGYRLGPVDGSKAGARSIKVTYFENETLEPRLAEHLNHALRKELQQEGTYTLVTLGDADIILKGEITHYQRSPLSFQPGDIQTARDYRLAITAKFTAIDTETGKVISSNSVQGETTLRVNSDLTSSERQAGPLMAKHLADKITTALTEGAW